MWNALGRLLVKFSDQTYVVCVWRSRFVDVCSCSRLGTPLNVKRAHLWVTSASFVYQSAESPSGPHSSSSKGRTSAARARLGIFEAFSLSHREREFVWLAFKYLPVKNVGKRIRTWSGRYRRKARQRKTVSHWIKLVSDLYVLRSTVFIACWRFTVRVKPFVVLDLKDHSRSFCLLLLLLLTAVLTLCCTLTLRYLIVWYNGAATVVQSLHASFFIYSSISLTCIICWVSNHTLNF